MLTNISDSGTIFCSSAFGGSFAMMRAPRPLEASGSSPSSSGTARSVAIGRPRGDTRRLGSAAGLSSAVRCSADVHGSASSTASSIELRNMLQSDGEGELR